MQTPAGQPQGFGNMNNPAPADAQRNFGNMNNPGPAQQVMAGQPSAPLASMVSAGQPPQGLGAGAGRFGGPMPPVQQGGGLGATSAGLGGQPPVRSMPAGIPPQPPVMQPPQRDDKSGGAPVNGKPAGIGMSPAVSAQDAMMKRANVKPAPGLLGPPTMQRKPPAPVPQVPPKPYA